MRTYCFLVTCAALALVGALAVVWARPHPPATLDDAEAQTLADLDLTARANTAGIRLERVQVNSLTRNDDGSYTIAVTITEAWRNPKPAYQITGRMVHGWTVARWCAPNEAAPEPC